MESPQLYHLPPGERYSPPLPPYGVCWALSLAPGAHARMGYRRGVVYLAMLHGKHFPADLTGPDLDRLGALGVLLGEQGWTGELEDEVPREAAETLARLLLSALSPGLHVRVCRAYEGPDVLRVQVTPPGVTVGVSATLYEEHAARLPALRDLIVRAVRRRLASP